MHARTKPGRYECMTDLAFWEDLYRRAKKLSLPPVLTGFNVNLDRILPVTRQLLDPAGFCHGRLEEVRSRLVSSMQHYTAEEWIMEDRSLYARLSSCFAGTGTITLGGQAGIAAAHLARLGAPSVTCIAPSMGPEVARMLGEDGVRVFGDRTSSAADAVHYIFEYAPGLVPPARDAIPRNNRFIISPVKTGDTTILADRLLAALLPELADGTRAFLSGYQYLKSNEEFIRAASQVQAIRDAGRNNRVHVECVSVTDPRINAGIVRHILPAADSAGMNENELSLLLGYRGEPGPDHLVKGVLELAKKTGLARIHLHTYGFYLLATQEDRARPELSRDALLYAATVTAAAARGTTTAVSPRGIAALRQITTLLGEGDAMGMWSTRDYHIQAVPTLIASDSKRTTGLGDILSSTAFVADWL
jgi:ADP-dependent phosphofructokinase/glucokinase